MNNNNRRIINTEESQIMKYKNTDRKQDKDDKHMENK